MNVEWGLSLLSLLTLELVYYLSVDHMFCATLAGVRVLGLFLWIMITQREKPAPPVVEDDKVISIKRAKKRF